MPALAPRPTFDNNPETGVHVKSPRINFCFNARAMFSDAHFWLNGECGHTLVTLGESASVTARSR